MKSDNALSKMNLFASNQGVDNCNKSCLWDFAMRIVYITNRHYFYITDLNPGPYEGEPKVLSTIASSFEKKL